MNEIANCIGMLGILILAAAFVWSFVLAFRQSGIWVIGLLFFWPVAYLLLMRQNRALTQGNNKILSIGLALCGTWFVIKMVLNKYFT
jgi:hypothetical protein